MNKKHSDRITYGRKKTSFVTGITRAFSHYEPLFPWAIAAVYFISMCYLTFRYHRIGGLGVETDFYVELVPQVKKLLEGRFSPLNYGAKGPVYSLLLVPLYLIMRDYFYAGLLLNIISGAVFLVTVYFLIKKVFNIQAACLSVLVILFNYVFLTYSYQAGSDMPFAAICALSMYFLYRSGKTSDLIVSALFGLLAFLTRYNGAFIAMGTVLYFAVCGGSAHERLKRIGLWVGVFLLAGLPWFIPNWIATGNPVHNDNYINVMLEFYGMGKEGVTYENWTDALPRDFTGLGDIILYDPVYFGRHMGHNLFTHFTADMKSLMGWRLGIFVIGAFVLLWFSGINRKKLIFFSFGFFYLLILTLVFYNVRFSLYLLVFYTPLAVWPLTSPGLTGRLKRFSWAPTAILILIILSFSYTTSKAVYREITHSPAFLKDLKDLGLALGKVEPDRSKKIIGRKPHVAYFAGLEALMFPGEPESVEELVGHCRKHSISYILYSGIEAQFRPHVRVLLNVDQIHPGLERVCYNRFGVIYRVIEK